MQCIAAWFLFFVWSLLYPYSEQIFLTLNYPFIKLPNQITGIFILELQ